MGHKTQATDAHSPERARGLRWCARSEADDVGAGEVASGESTESTVEWKDRAVRNQWGLGGQYFLVL